jgi:hypothetical protein
MAVVAGSISIHYLKQHENLGRGDCQGGQEGLLCNGRIPVDFALTLALFRDRNPGWIGIEQLHPLKLIERFGA